MEKLTIGSEKQINWASELRDELIAKLSACIKFESDTYPERFAASGNPIIKTVTKAWGAVVEQRIIGENDNVDYYPFHGKSLERMINNFSKLIGILENTNDSKLVIQLRDCILRTSRLNQEKFDSYLSDQIKLSK